MPDPIAPIVNDNGTNPEELLENIDFAHLRIQDAMDAMKHCAPNGRDARDQEHMEQLIIQHTQRMKPLSDLLDSLHQEAALILEQMDRSKI